MESEVISRVEAAILLLLLTAAGASRAPAQSTPLTINTTSVPAATRGVSYSAPLSASGGIGSYFWSLSSSSAPLPGGLSAAAGGAVSGTPALTAIAGNYGFTVQVTDSSGTSVTQVLNLKLLNPAITLSSCAFPTGIVGTAYSSCVSAAGGNGGPYTYSWSPTPPGLSLDPSTGAITGTPTGPGTFSFTIGVSDGSNFTPPFAGQGYSITIDPSITLAPTTILPADALSTYSQTFTAVGGSGSGYTYSISSTPPGMSFNSSSGTLSGPPSSNGSFSFTITARDSAGFTGTSPIITLTVNPALTLPPLTLTSGQAGTSYSQTFTASGGSGGYTYTFSGTAVPGLNFNASTLSGIPAKGGTYTFSVTATDSLRYSVTNSYTLSVANPPITVSPASIPSGQVGVPYSQVFTASGGNGGPYTFSIVATTLFGLTFTASTATLSGSPTGSGSTTVIVTAGDGTVQGQTSYTLTIAPPTLTLSPSSIPNGTVGTPYSQTFTASGGLGTYSFSIIGTQPPGLNLTPSGATATLVGTPTTGGAYVFTVQVSDGTNKASQNLNVTVTNPPITLAPGSLAAGIVNGTYSQTFAATGGNGGPYTYSLTGTIPGLSLFNGILSGTPTTAGTYNVTIGVSDGSPFTPAFTPKGYSITVYPAITISPATIPPADSQVNYSQTFTASGGTGSGYTYSINTPPPGLNLNASTGVLSGPPSSGGRFTISARDSAGFTGAQNYTLAVNSPLTLSPATLSAIQTGTSYSQTFTASGGSGGYTYSFSGTPVPGLNFSAGVFSGSPTTAGSYSFSITARDSVGGSASNNYTLAVNNPPLTLGPGSLPAGIVNGAYSQTFTASGGNGGPYTYSLTGTIPGLSLFNGILSGTPTTAGTYNVTIGVSDGSPFTPAFTPKSYSVTVYPAVTISPATIPPADAQANYSQTFTAAGGTGSGYTYSITATPPGLTLNASTGVLSGPPSSGGSFTISARDSAGFTGSQNYTLAVNSPPTLAPATLSASQTGTSYSQTFMASGGSGGYTYSFSGTPVPGLNFSAGVLSGSPTTAGSYSFSITARDSLGGSASNNYTLAVNNPPLTLGPGSLPAGIVGAYSQTFTASGGNGGPYTYSLTGAIPGLSLFNGILSGTPTTAGTYNFTIGVSDGSPFTAAFTPKSYSITVYPAITIGPATIPAADAQVNYSLTFTAAGGTGSGYTYSINTPPPGLTLNASTGVLSGPSSSGGSFTITARDSAGFTGSQNYTLAVNSPLTLAPATLSAIQTGTSYSQTFTASGGSGGYTYTLGGTPGPGLNFSSGVLSGSPTTAGSYSFSITAKDSLGGSVTSNYTLTIDNPPLILGPASLPAGIVNGTYSQTFTASGGNGGLYTYSLTGAIPGLTLSSGTLSGTPTAAGTYNFTIGLSDGSPFTPAFTPKSYSITVYSAIMIGPATIPAADLQVNYLQTFTASGGTGSGYTYSINTTFPGLTLNASTGVLIGPPSSGGSFTITARDSAGFTGAQNYTLTVNPTLTLSPATLASGQVGTGYSQAFTASGGSGGYTYSLVGSAPGGLSLNLGVLSGSPTVSGQFSFSISAKDSLGGTATNAYTLTIANPPVIVQPSSLPSGQMGVFYSQLFTASGGNGGPYTYSITAAAPFGLGFTPATATLSGTPTSSGSASVTISATDGTLTGQRTYTLTVLPAGLTLSPSTMANGIVGIKYSQTFTASGGLGSYTITLSPSAPPGLTFTASGATATLSGIPTMSGSFPLTVQVTDGTSTLPRNYTLAISASALSIQTTSLPGGTTGISYAATLSATGGTPPYTWSLLPGNGLPSGLSLLPSGIITGSPNGYGTVSFGVMVTDSSGVAATASLSIVLGSAPLQFTTTSPLPPALSGVNYAVTFGASGGVPPYTFALSSGPFGLSLSGAVLSGKITNLGSGPVTYNLSMQLTDHAGGFASAGFKLTVQPAAAGLILSAGSLVFTAVSGGSVPLPEYVSVSSTTQADVTFTVGSDSPWLSATPSGSNLSTPATLQINVNQSGLQPSTTPYTGNITVTGPDGPHTVPVSLTVNATPPQLSVAPTIISFSTDGISQPGPGAIQVSNAGDGTVTFSASVTNGSAWVSLGSAPTTVSGGSPVSIALNAVIAGLAPGAYRDVIHFDSSAGTADVPVTLLVAGGSTINLAPAGSLFSSRQGQGVSDGTQSFEIITTGTSPVNWTATLLGGSGWLTLNTASGTSAPNNPGVVSYTVDPSNLATGDYYARIHIDAPSVTNSPVEFVVVSTVAPTSTPAVPDPSPAGLLFISSPGSPLPSAQNILINTSSATPVSFSTAANTYNGGTWLMVAPANGVTSTAVPGEVSVTINTAGLATGVYQGGISFTLQGNPTGVRTVNVVLIVTGSAHSPTLVPRISVMPDAAGCAPLKIVAVETGLVSNFSTPAGWPTPLAIQLADDCGNAVTNASVVATFSNGDAPLALQLSDSKNAVYSATWNPHGTSSQVTVTARATAPNLQAATAQIVGAISPNKVPILYQHGTIHNLNPQPGAPLAPGTIVQIYGSGLAPATLQTSLPLPTNVNGTIVIIGGIQAPLYYVSDGQLNAQLPLELSPSRQYQILISANGALTAPDTLDIEPVTPGVAALPNGTIIAQHVDASYVTAASPAHPGEILTIYLAGMGLTDVSVKTGQISPSSPLAHPMVQPTVTVNGESAQVSFAGLTPQAVGLYQINFTVPPDAPSGNLTLVVAQGNVQSNSGTLAVQ
jgi:uncharacterized protein (TIGR03437 family)